MLHGKNLKIYKNGTAIACARSCEISTEGETIETASPSSSTAKEYIRGRYGWSISCSGLVSSSSEIINALLLCKSGALTISFSYNNGTKYGGTAFCTSCKVTGTVGNLTQMSVSFQGSGELAEV